MEGGRPTVDLFFRLCTTQCEKLLVQPNELIYG